MAFTDEQRTVQSARGSRAYSRFDDDLGLGNLEILCSGVCCVLPAWGVRGYCIGTPAYATLQTRRIPSDTSSNT